MLEEWLFYGSLPEIFLTREQQEKERLLESYVTVYLEEEVRSEALVRSLGSFARLLELAVSESGYPVNFSKLSQEIGMRQQMIVNLYAILEDCLVVHGIEPITASKKRKRLTKSHKYLFFDRRCKARGCT